VLPVGGIKEKVLAAHRSGVKTVILPKFNQIDLEELPEEVRQQLQFIFADTIEDVLYAALDRDARGEPSLPSEPSQIRDANQDE